MAADEPLQRSIVSGGVILHDPRRLPEPAARTFDPAHWLARGDVVATHEGRGTVHVVDAGEEEWVVRHLRRGGFPARIVEDRYLRMGAGRSRPFRELKLLRRLRREGLAVPPPVAAGYWPRGLTHAGDIITVRVPGRPLRRYLTEGNSHPPLWRRVGATLRRFHRAGVYHADLSAGNILVDEEQVTLIDFDRGRIRRPGPWQRRNLARLQRSATKILGPEVWQSPAWTACWRALLEGYREGGG